MNKNTLNPYRRHTASCKKSKPHLTHKMLKACDCPLWVTGTVNGKALRQTLNTTDLAAACETIVKLEAGETPAVAITPRVPVSSLTIDEAFEQYTKFLLSQRGTKASTVSFFINPIKKDLMNFAASRNVTALGEVTADLLDDLVASWDVEPSTANRRIGTIQRFFNRCVLKGLIEKNPASLLERPKLHGNEKKTLPFDLETEDVSILRSIPNWHEGCTLRQNNAWCNNTATGAAFLYVLRYTGLRVSDAITFEPKNLKLRVIDGQEVYCYFVAETQKTGASVFIPISKEIGDVIVNAPRLTAEYAFYDGSSVAGASDEAKMKHLRYWQGVIALGVLKALETVSGVSDIRCHRFRDTFACDLLAHEVDIRTVSRMLGHSSVATTLNYYEHYMVSDQNKAVRSMMAAWGNKAAAATV